MIAVVDSAIASHCSGPSGSPSTIAPDTMATIGTMIDDSPAMFDGSRSTIANQQMLPMVIGTSVIQVTTAIVVVDGMNQRWSPASAAPMTTGTAATSICHPVSTGAGTSTRPRLRTSVPAAQPIAAARPQASPLGASP